MSWTSSGGFGHGPFGHAAASGAFGHGPFLTFPFTPGYIHGEQIAYAVTAARLADATEQRYLAGRQQGRSLSYEFPLPDSGTISSVTSFFLDMGGPYRRFLVLNHRTGIFSLARFADVSLEQGRAAPMVRSLRVAFVTEQTGGTAPLGTAPKP
jgi:hypothetical protein